MWRTEDDVQQMLRESAEAWAAAEAGADRFRRFRASGTGFDPATWAAMGALGWTGILLPEERGGSGLGLAPALTLADVLGRHLVMAPFVPSAVVAATLLAGAAGAGPSMAMALASGSQAPLAALREGANEAVPQTPATTFAAGRLNGAKAFVAGWHLDAPLLVSALGSEGLVIALVQPGAPGLSAKPRLMADGTRAADLVFADTEAEPILTGTAAQEALSLAICREALGLSAMLEGLAAQLFELTVDYVGQRIQFEKPLAAFQALRHHMVDLHAQIELAGATWRVAARRLDAEGFDAAAGRVAMAKARAGDAAHAMGKAAIQYHGAFGYTEEADIGLYANAILRLVAQGGNPMAQRRVALAHHKRTSPKETRHVEA